MTPDDYADLKPEPVRRKALVRLARTRTATTEAVLRRVLPGAVPEDGVAKLDVCAFNSSI